VISSEQFQEKLDRSSIEIDEYLRGEEEEKKGAKIKGLSRRPSKKEKRARAALKKL
jgi:hypothetical protein